MAIIKKHRARKPIVKSSITSVGTSSGLSDGKISYTLSIGDIGIWFSEEEKQQLIEGWRSTE